MTAGAIAGAILIPNVAGWVGLVIGVVKNRIGITWWNNLPTPWFNPPNWLLAIVWTIWYSTMGYASYLIYRDCGGFTSEATLPLSIYAAHLVINCSWTPVFLRTRNSLVGLIHILLLDAAAVANAAAFGVINLNALYLMIPFLSWMVFDTSLMFIVWKANKDIEVLDDDEWSKTN